MKTEHSHIAEHDLPDARTGKVVFNEHETIHDLKHYLPAQAPLKDFIHHNTLHAFQNSKFFPALQTASEMFGYKVSLSLKDYRLFYQQGKIREDILERTIAEQKGADKVKDWKDILINKKFKTTIAPRIGALRTKWKELHHLNLDSLVHPILFRILCSYLDQGISIWNFPVEQKGFLTAMREIERTSYSSFFRTKKIRDKFLHNQCEVTALLDNIVGDPSLYKQYLFDQQFAHQGWSGMVSTVEDQPQTLLDTKKISLHELIVFELLLEEDALTFKLGEGWKPLADRLKTKPKDLFGKYTESELNEVLILWQNAFEWSYYDQVLSGLKTYNCTTPESNSKNFQVLLCIDDREISLRRYLENIDPSCETFGTPGFFGVEFFYQPEQGKFYTKLCPAPITPKYLVKEVNHLEQRKTDVTMSKQTHSLVRGWVISQTLGFWSALKLLISIFRPSETPSMASSFEHMDKASSLTFENKDVNDIENGLQIGFTIEEMTNRVEGVLKSIGLVKNFAPLVYAVGHGSSSVNNPHFSAYDCGACSGRPGSVNARVFANMANMPEVRKKLAERGLVIPNETQFLGGLHDTCRDEVQFYDEGFLLEKNKPIHEQNLKTFYKALDFNAKERSRKFVSIKTKLDPKTIHHKIRQRSVSLFEPRPELNHATNALCIVGSRRLTKELYLDRRSFLNSYDHKIDPEGKLLTGIMRPLGPVCGGINLEYFFSRVDNQKLGAGTKLPHNVMGLFGVANGIDGDLRPGLPSQMIEVHDPIRLMLIVEHYPEVVLNVIKSDNAMYEWYINEWVHLVALHPETRQTFYFKDGGFKEYEPLKKIQMTKDITTLIEETEENLPVYILNS
jgi:uncharacterized protein YbcC (UPF0753/DUF2309 family)